jgi:hypothetical protein
VIITFVMLAIAVASFVGGDHRIGVAAILGVGMFGTYALLLWHWRGWRWPPIRRVDWWDQEAARRGEPWRS